MSDDTSTQTQDDSGYAPIRVESFWGAVALIALCQIYYYILFEGFVFVSGTNVKLLYVWFGILFLVSVGAQVEVMVKINAFFSKQRPETVEFIPETTEEWMKFFLAIVFGLIFILFCLGRYPFPSVPHEWWHTLLFYVLVWVLSYGASVNFKKGIDSKQPKGLMNLVPVIMGMGFFTAGAFLGDIFYMVGTFGMGFAMIPGRALLLANNTKKKGVKF